MVEIKGSNTVMDFGTHFQVAFQKHWVVVGWLQQCLQARFSEHAPAGLAVHIIPDFLPGFLGIGFPKLWVFGFLFVTVNLVSLVLLALLGLGFALFLY